MSHAAPESRRRAKPSERLSQSVPDIEFDPNDNTYRHKSPSPSSSKRPAPSRGVRRSHSNEGMKKAEATTASMPAESDKKRPGRKKPSSMHDSNTQQQMSSSKSDVRASSSNDASIKSSSGDKTTLKRKKKRPEDGSLHASKEGLSASRASSMHASKESLSASRSSLNASKESLSASRSSLNASKETRRRRSTSRSKASSRRSTSRSKADSQHNDHHRSSASRRDRSSSRDNHSKAPSIAEKSRSKNEKPSTAPSTQAAVRKSAINNTMAVPIKTSSNNKLYDVDRPRQQSLKQKLAAAQDDASIQSNQLLTKEQKAWKGIDDILDNDHESIATRDVLPESIAKAMHRDKQHHHQQQQPVRPNNNATPMPELMNSSFSSIRSEMTSLTLNTAITGARNYVLQEPVSGSAADPMQAFLGSIAEQIISETAAENSHGNAAYPVALNDTVDKPTDIKNDTLRSRSTESSSGGSIGIQEYYASSSSKLQHAPMGSADDDEEHDSENEDDRRYDPIVQAYGRATMPPKKSSNQSGQSMVDNMPPLMDSSFSSLQSEQTDVQSIISIAKNFVIKDDKPPEDDDPMSAFLGRITNGLRARQMLAEEQCAEEDEVSGEHKAVVLEDLAAEDDETENEQVYAYDDHHIPAEDELSGAGPSIPDENDLSGAELDDDNADGAYNDDNYDDDEIEESSESEPNEKEGMDPNEEDLENPGHDVATYLPPNTPGGVGSIPSLSSVSTMGTNQETADPLAKWAANLREELAQKIAGGNAPLTEEDEEMAEMEKALARAAEIASAEKNETDITRVVLDEEVVQGVIEESQKQRTKAAGPPRKKKVMKKKVPPAGTTGETVAAKGGRPAPGRRRVLKKKKPPVKPLPAPAEEPEKFSAMFKEEERPEQVARQKPSMPVAAVKAVAKATIPIPKQSKKDKYEQKSTLKSLKEKLQKLTFLRGKSSRRMSPATVGGDEGKYFPREHREEEEDEDASFL